MGKKLDPRKPRPNPELKDIERVIRNNWTDFRTETNHTRKRGYAMVLAAALEQWLDEPPYLTDLAEGAVPPPEDVRRGSGLVDGAETLFEKPGEAKDTFFWLGSNQIPTTVFVGSEADPHDPWRLSGFVVRRMQKVYATRNETLNHFTSEVALRRHTGREPRPPLEKGRLFVLCDPRGYYDGCSALAVATFKSLASARRKAETLAGTFGIRFVVARLEGWVDTH